MTTFLHLGKQIVNVEHVVSADWLEAEPERQAWSYGENVTVAARPCRVMLTLTSLKESQVAEQAAASVSETAYVEGDMAVKLWAWFENRADIVNLEPVAQ